MTKDVEAKAVRALLAGVLSSDLTQRELLEVARALRDSDQLGKRVGEALAITVQAPSSSGVPSEPEASNSVSIQVRDLSEQLYQLFRRKGWSSNRVYKVLRTVAGPGWKPSSRASVREAVNDAVRAMSDSRLGSLEDLLREEGVTPDPFLTGILRKDRDP